MASRRWLIPHLNLPLRVIAPLGLAVAAFRLRQVCAGTHGPVWRLVCWPGCCWRRPRPRRRIPARSPASCATRRAACCPARRSSPSTSRAARASSASTDEHGRYFLPSLRVGTYVITVELAGFRRVVRSGVDRAARADAHPRLHARRRRADRGDQGHRRRRRCCRRRTPRSATSSRTARSCSSR